MDHLVCQAARQGTSADLDLSFMTHLLTSQGKNVMDTTNWLPMIWTLGNTFHGAAGGTDRPWAAFRGPACRATPDLRLCASVLSGRP